MSASLPKTNKFCLLLTLSLLIGQTALPLGALAQSSNVEQAPALTLPNYWGDARVNNAAYGDYRNPYVGSPVYNNGTVNTKSTLPSNFGATNYDNQRTAGGSGSGFNPMGLMMGGAMVGGGALMMGAGRMAALGRGGLGHSMGSSPKAHANAMVKAERRRKEQEEKIQKELAQAHEQNMRKRGLNQPRPEENMARNEAPPPSMVSERGLASQKFQDNVEGEVMEGDTARALSF